MPRRTNRKRSVRIVRYSSPFGSPAWMRRSQARKLLAEDDARFLDHEEINFLSDAQRQHGPPRIEGGAS